MDRHIQSELPYLDVAEVGFSTKSDAVYSARADSGCAKTPYGLAVLSHRHVGRLLRDRRLRQGSYAWPLHQGAVGSFAEFWMRSIIGREGASHKALRMVAVPALAEEFIQSMIPAFDQVAEDLCAALRQSSECEFQQDFAVPFAGQAICILLGLDRKEWPHISEDASLLGLAMGVEYKRHEQTVNDACDRLMGLAERLVARARSGEDATGFVARLVAGADRYDEVSEQDILDLVVISIFGGVDTTRSQLGFLMSLFYTHPEQWVQLYDRQDRIPAAIEERIRHWPTTTWVSREAVEDFVYEGVDIAKGTTLHLWVHASGTDPSLNEAPAFDVMVDRKMHHGFGGGAHHCLWHFVALTDMASGLRALLGTFETAHIEGDPKYLPDSGNTSPEFLPLRYRLR